MPERLRVGILFGGRSAEHEVSLLSAASILRALDRERFEPVPIKVRRSGEWLLPADPEAALAGDAGDRGERLLLAPGAGAEAGLWRVRGDRPEPFPLDLLFPVLHGPFGEDGTVQGACELAGLPYVGSGVAGSAVGMDKGLMKALFQARGLPVVRHLVLSRHRWERDPEGVVAEVRRTLPFPLFVKPANLGSSVGIGKARTEAELRQALEEAARYDRRLVVEEGIDAREIECSVLGNEEPIASLPGEILPSNEFYDYAAKYVDGRSALIIPADLDAATVETLRELALAAFDAVDGAGMARVDFFLERGTGRVLINEVNTIPGFTAISMYPKLWEASGLPYRELITRLIELALARHAVRRRLVPDRAPARQEIDAEPTKLSKPQVRGASDE